jgi:hypothetical protein
LEGEKPATLSVRDVLFVPAGKLHMAHNRGPAHNVELAKYLVEKGKPLLVRANGPKNS